MPKEKYYSSDFRERLRSRFDKGYLVLDEVSEAIGFGRGSIIDVVVLGLWESKGLDRKAFEIKVSRGDFLREIGSNKNQWAREAFHEFWYVTPKDIVKTVDEIPEGCGWMVPRGKGLGIAKAAQRKDNPPFDIYLFTSLIASVVKERDSSVSRAMATFRKDDSLYLEGQNYKNAVTKFLQERGADLYRMNVPEEEILNALCMATLDKQVRKENEKIQNVLNHFQERMLSLFKLFTILAHVGLEEKEHVDSVLLNWNPKDTFLLAAERAIAKKARELKKFGKERKGLSDDMDVLMKLKEKYMEEMK